MSEETAATCAARGAAASMRSAPEPLGAAGGGRGGGGGGGGAGGVAGGLDPQAAERAVPAVEAVGDARAPHRRGGRRGAAAAGDAADARAVAAEVVAAHDAGAEGRAALVGEDEIAVGVVAEIDRRIAACRRGAGHARRAGGGVLHEDLVAEVTADPDDGA